MTVTSDTMDVAGFAAAVRRALAGLSPELVEDLTDGLEADLAEALADAAGTDPVAQFGTPEEYAAELRTAAGIEPAAPVVAGRKRREWLRHPVRALRRQASRLLTALRGTRWWPPVEDFLVALRPLWWVLRGWVVYRLALWAFSGSPESIMPSSGFRLGALVALVVVSVQWGRGAWRAPARLQPLAVFVSAAAAVLALPMVASADTGPDYIYEPYPEPYLAEGVVVDGMQVSNLYVYDAEGNPLGNVQIFDDRGRPVRTLGEDIQGEYFLYGVDQPWSWLPATDQFGQPRWNVYPLLGAPSARFAFDGSTGRWGLLDGDPAVPPLPFAKAPAIVVPGAEEQADETAPPTVAPTPGPSAGVTPDPSDSPTTSPPDGRTTPSDPAAPPTP